MAKRQKKLKLSDQIYQISTLAAGNFELQEVLDRLAEAAVKVTDTTACSIRLLDDNTGDLKMRSTYGLSEEYRNKGPVTLDEPVIKEAFSGRAVVLDDMRLDPRVRYREATIQEGLISQLTVAMTFKGKPLGVLRLYSPEPNRFNRQAIRVARLVASQCATAITNARLFGEALEGAKMKQQMDLAAAVQRRMIPEKAPCMCGLDLAAIYKPCHEIGGDLYDFFAIDEHRIIVSIADVIGKGVPAAIMMSMFRGAMRAYADGGYGRHEMREIIQKLNLVACRECRNGEFITLFLACIDTQAGMITYCNCGHEPGLLLPAGKPVQNLEKGGLVMGLMEHAQYETETLPFNKNDCLLLYTDGLIDAVNFEGKMWGKERLLTVLDLYRESSSAQLVHTILGYRRRFVGLASQFDDTSVLAIRKIE
ncbi:MAG: SpoIIE family protein phosphatase [Sedimentisphaerales bacterium]|nr:SpoIIE family protein phosphatase [Sedimentisphaerales bacterium]